MSAPSPLTCRPATDADKQKYVDLKFNFDGRQSCSVGLTKAGPLTETGPTLECKPVASDPRPPLSQVYGTCLTVNSRVSMCFFDATQQKARDSCQSVATGKLSMPFN